MNQSAMVTTREGPRLLRFAILASTGHILSPQGLSNYVFCSKQRWEYLHMRGRQQLRKRLLTEARLFTTYEQACEIAAALSRTSSWPVNMAVSIQAVGWIAYCADDGVDHSDCRNHPGLSRACIESRRTPSRLHLVTA